MNLTKKEAVRLHRLMWTRIANAIKAGHLFSSVTDAKDEILNDMRDHSLIGINETISFDCFCCEHAKNSCRKCPVIWNGGRCLDSAGEYRKFQEAIDKQDYVNACSIAKEIARLPEREDKDFDVL